MEFRCPHCDHIGPAEDVRTGEEGVEVVCAACERPSPLEEGEDDADASSPEETDPGTETQANASDAESNVTEPAPEAGASTSDPQLGDETPGSRELEAALAEAGEEHDGVEPDPEAIKRALERDSFGGREGFETGTTGPSRDVASIPEDVLDRLVPDPEETRRCPKCVAALPNAHADHCPECGLDLEQARAYDDGAAPWEQYDRVDDETLDRARTLWEPIEEVDDEADVEAFVEFVREQELFGFGIRRLRFHLVDHPDDERAIEALRTLASGMEAKIATAQARAEADAEEFQDSISRFKRHMVWVSLVLWGLAMLLFGDIFLGWEIFS